MFQKSGNLFTKICNYIRYYLIAFIASGQIGMLLSRRMQRTHASVLIVFNLIFPLNTVECCCLTDISAKLRIVSNTVLLLQS